MHRSIGRPLVVVTLAGLLAMGLAPSHAQTAAMDLSVSDIAGHAVQLSLADLQALPPASVTLSGEHGESLHFTGPTLWTVLQRAGAVDANFHHRVRQTITATGQDGYSVVLAMGEVDPEFENKPVLLAIDLDRHSLRIAIPGDKRLGRDVRDVASLAVH